MKEFTHQERIQYLTECLEFHEKRAKEEWEAWADTDVFDFDKCVKHSQSYYEHKRQIKWYKRKLQEPVNPLKHLEGEPTVEANFTAYTPYDSGEESEEGHQEPEANYLEALLDTHNDILRNLSTPAKDEKVPIPRKSNILRRLWNKIRGK